MDIKLNNARGGGGARVFATLIDWRQHQDVEAVA
jgi:hypothetical protein